MRPVKLLTDSTSDLPREIIEQYEISIIPLYVNFGTQSFRDGVDIKPAELYRKVKETGKLPTTSAISESDFAREFNKHIDNQMDIMHISISSKISASYRNACTVAEQFPAGRIKVIDSLNLSSGIGLNVLAAAACIRRGMSLDETANEVQSVVKKVRSQFIIDTVEYLHKGGRCSGLQMLLSSILEIHPIIAVTDGSMHMAAKIRGNRQVVLNTLIKDTIAKIGSMDLERLVVAHSECRDDAIRVAGQLEKMNKIRNIIISDASCVIASHCGPNSIGIFYLEE
ncbi:MAG: DegV family protein [Dehalococcoidales bacterium]|nr:DegV family protein [Dehalococcoidales bacterium]